MTEPTPETPATPNPPTHAEADAFLTAAGFVHDSGLKGAAEDMATAANMHKGGPYVVHGVYTRGTVSITIEENTDTRVEGGMKTMTTYHPVVVISGPKGTVAAPISDPQLVLRMADELG